MENNSNKSFTDLAREFRKKIKEFNDTKKEFEKSVKSLFNEYYSNGHSNMAVLYENSPRGYNILLVDNQVICDITAKELNNTKESFMGKLYIKTLF